VVIHSLNEDSRKYYDLELLWGDAPQLDWQAQRGRQTGRLALHPPLGLRPFVL
jgi:hypothetical protein